uniref:Testis-expressed sequence 2 protein n=1 Tax=Gopherus evgoodei TaxID=1825980 RepID=A0A8C4WR49_9SAUR
MSPMTLETKMNLCKLGKEALAEESGVKPRVILLADSDAESSSAGSSDEDILAAEPSGALGERIVPLSAEGGSNSTSRRILRFVDKIAKSKYFQKATENGFIKKKIEEVSNTPLLLTVEVQELSGTLAVNIPPPPTDRIWYSFRIPPQLELKVHPKLGEREVTFIHVTEWIERKLQHEFQKILVMPNMDDLIIPIMHSGLEPQLSMEGPFKDLPGA